MASCTEMSTFIRFLDELVKCIELLLEEGFPPASMLYHKTRYWELGEDCSAADIISFIREKWKHFESLKALSLLTSNAKPC